METLTAAQAVVDGAARSWPGLDAGDRAAAFAAAIDAVEGVDWLPMAEQHHLLAAKTALLAGTAEGLGPDERRLALAAAADSLARVRLPRRERSRRRGRGETGRA